MERRITRQIRKLRALKAAKMDLDVCSLLCDKLKIHVEDLETKVSDLEEELSTLQEENYLGVPAPRSLTEEMELESRLAL